MKLKLSYIYYAFLLALLSAYSCVDDRLYDSDKIGEGMATVSAEISFDRFVHALSRATSGGASGDAINNMTDICVLLYKTDGSILTDDSGEPIKYYFSNVATEITDHNKPSDQVVSENEGEHWAQSDVTSTVKAKVELTDIPYGRYRIYAIANVPESEFTDEVISDINKVKDLHFAWNDDDIASNDQMFGYFSSDNSSKGYDAPEVVVNNPDVNLHAWVKRMASKVTVAFDASNLYDDINIYLISATIKDIPANCYLGKDNCPGSYTPVGNEMNDLIATGQTIMYVDDPEGTPLDENWPATISNKNPVFGFNTEAIQDASRSVAQKLEAQHGELVNALYFYENLQGIGNPGTASDKWQVVQGSEDKSKPSFPDGNIVPDGSDATDPAATGYKDNKIHGSYVEVKAYYISNNPKDISRGNITYRFMLGKDTHTDFNAERNHHYKVTLRFNGYANDIDWHIDFDQTPEIVGTTPNYISYLYNQSMEYSFTVVGGELLELSAEIPDNEITQGSWHPMDGQVKNEDKSSVYWTGDVYDPGPWNGFLSLRKTTVAEYNATDGAPYQFNKKVFEGQISDGKEQYKLGYREYVKDSQLVETNSDYSIEEMAPGVWSVKVSLFTRPRVMVATTGYSGNNPYMAYNRKSQVIFRAKVKRNGIVYNLNDTIDLLQARRIVNPKAIWREANSVKPFHVQLKIMESQNGNRFTNLLSYGPWKAEVICGKDWIELIPTPNASERHSEDGADGPIYGFGNQYDSGNTAGRTIDFTLKPKSTTSVPRGGIIRIYYNNYSCVHNIFVRQGFAPVQFYGEGPMWHTCNLRVGGNQNTEAEEVKKPQFEGSYFRIKNRQYPIDASSNTAPIPFEIEDGMDKLFNIAGPNGSIMERRLWLDITSNEYFPPDGWWGTFKVKLDNKEVECRMPGKTELDNIMNRTSTIYGYGVLYGDEASETLDGIDEVYGANPDNPSYGMRGVIMCDENSGTQLFFPVAASGYGRFKQYTPIDSWDRLPKDWGGVVQYSTRYSWFPNNPGDPGQNVSYKPLFYDIYSSQGSLYWLNWGNVIDINYVTLGLSVLDSYAAKVTFGTNADPSGSDAIHLRLVHDP